MSKKVQSGSVGGGAFESLVVVLGANLSNLYSLSMRHVEDVAEIRFKHRGGGEWLVIVKRWGDDGAPEVLFATGFDFVSALMAANAAIARGSWREDRPWTGGK